MDIKTEKDVIAMKSVLVIGMGGFGHHLVNKLIDQKKTQIMVVDKNEDNIRDMFGKVSNARIGDCTRPDVLKALKIENYDEVIVCIEKDFQNSLEVTSLVKESGAKYVTSVASRDIHAKFLLRNGADYVVYPDRDLADKIAVRLSVDNVYDYIALTDEYSIYEIAVPSAWHGKSIKEINVRAVYNVNIIAVVSGDGTINVMPNVDDTFGAGDHVKVLARKSEIEEILGKMRA
jgi:trk system potassium uptake protein TrkA